MNIKDDTYIPSCERIGGRGPSDAELADMEERQADRERGGKGELSAAYRSMIGPPPACGPGDHKAAREYLTGIYAAIDKGGWTRSEWSRLCRIRDKWQRRASGNDPRFEAMGNKIGGMDSHQKAVWQMHRDMASASKWARDTMTWLNREMEASDVERAKRPTERRARR